MEYIVTGYYCDGQGDYEYEARVYDAKGREAGCLSLDLSVKLQSLKHHQYGTDLNEGDI
jgi:hypothetical protein